MCEKFVNQKSPPARKQKIGGRNTIKIFECRGKI